MWRRTSLFHSVGTYGWSGGLGTAWYNDPAEDLVMILMTQRAFSSSSMPAICGDFFTTTYAALED
jgi:CubicO group peptidase (beta-lactamase class C family)